MRWRRPFRGAGARCLIVSGVVDPVRGVDVDQIPQVALTLCRLRADRDELRQRFVNRAGGVELLEAVSRGADAFDASEFSDVCVDTTGMPPTRVAQLVKQRTGAWPAAELSQTADAIEPPGQTTTGADGQILWLCGTTGVGKSAVGFEIYQRVLQAGFTAAYLDLDQVGFCHPVPVDDPGNHRVKARNLAALWQTFRSAGAEHLVVTGPLQDQAAFKTYTNTLPEAEFTLWRLHADREHLTQRIMQGGQGGGSWPQPGDPLLGESAVRLRDIADEAAASASALEAAAVSDGSIDTDGHTVEEVADAILAETKWLRPRG